MMKKYRRQRRRLQPSSEISMTPLIDTALTLLIIFMITTPMMQNMIKVNLPHGDAKEDSSTHQELVVSIDKSGELFFNGKSYKDTDIIDVVRKEVGAQKEQTVYVKADQDVHYGKVIDLVDRLKVVGGVEYVALATQKRV